MDPMQKMMNPYMGGFDPSFMMPGMMPGMGMNGNMGMPNQGMPGDGMIDLFMGMQMGNQTMGNPNGGKAEIPSSTNIETDAKEGKNEEK